MPSGSKRGADIHEMLPSSVACFCIFSQKPWVFLSDFPETTKKTVFEKTLEAMIETLKLPRNVTISIMASRVGQDFVYPLQLFSQQETPRLQAGFHLGPK